jgi:hypothetical protein
MSAAWRKTELEKAQELKPEAGLAQRVDRLERAFQAELTSSASLNGRGSALAVGSSLAILLLAEFSATWLDDSEWDLPRFWDTTMLNVLLPASMVALVLCIVLAVRAVWPKRTWADLQKGRVTAMSLGESEDEARALLMMVELQRATNERKARLLRWTAAPLAVAIVAVIAQSMVFAFKAEPVLPPRAGGPEKVQVDDESGLPSREDQALLAATYAPRVWLHRDEKHGPLDPADFIRGSQLVWHERNRKDRVAARGKVDAARLGVSCGSAAGGCYERSGYLAREFTRPYDTSKSRAKGLLAARGFALEPDGDAQRGQARRDPDVPMFWEVRKGAPGELLVNYWFHYGYSLPNNPGAKAVQRAASHDGDWENVEVVLDVTGGKTGGPIAVLFYGHGTPLRVAWKDVCKVSLSGDCASADSNHPVVYSALHSHASYAQAGSRKVHGDAGTATDVTNAGWRWDAWDRLDGLRRAKDEPWFGFGGSWGRAKGIPGTDGPLGPSRWKLPSSPDPGDLASTGG